MVKRRRTAHLDPRSDYRQIVEDLTSYEFPWDINQALNFALFRTFAVPSIGRLLDQTGEFRERPQKRYDDTALLLEAPQVEGFDSAQGRAAIRRINQMHRSYDIPNHEMVYVLSTFVVMPKRWLDAYGWRPLSTDEVEASVRYYRHLGTMMAISDMPETYEGFEELMDSYERERFGFDPAARRTADATMGLMASFYPRRLAPLVNLFSRSLMEPHLLAAFRYDDPGPLVRAASAGALRLRARVVALLPPRRRPMRIIDKPEVRSYPQGYRVEEMGTFPARCPVPHAAEGAAQVAR